MYNPKAITVNKSEKPITSPEDLSSTRSIISKGKGSKINSPLLLISCNLLTVTARLGIIIARTNIDIIPINNFIEINIVHIEIA